MSDVAFIGKRGTIWPFKALGADVFFYDEGEPAQRLLAEALQGEYKIIFVTETVYENLRDRIDNFAEEATPTFAVIPSIRGSRGVATKIIRDSVRRAMGAEFI